MGIMFISSIVLYTLRDNYFNLITIYKRTGVWFIMGDMSVIIMEKDRETGFLSKELGSYGIRTDMDMIDRVFAVPGDGKSIVNLYITVPGEFEDWEFNAILDNYNAELYEGKVESIEEDEDSYNPTWLVKFEFLENDDAMEARLNEILEIHDTEVKRVLEAIKGMEDDYRE
jgi:hypothetical protein